jgi:hypothetical protein
MGLTKLPAHLPTLSMAFVVFTVVHLVLAPLASRKWFPVAYASKGRRARNNWWDLHECIRTNNNCIIGRYTLSHRCIRRSSCRCRCGRWLERGVTERGTRRLGGTTMWGLYLRLRAGGSCLVHMRFALTVLHRYFLWDTLDAIVNFIDLGFVVHGACAGFWCLLRLLDEMQVPRVSLFISCHLYASTLPLLWPDLISRYADPIHGILRYPVPSVGNVRVFTETAVCRS